MFTIYNQVRGSLSLLDWMRGLVQQHRDIRIVVVCVGLSFICVLCILDSLTLFYLLTGCPVCLGWAELVILLFFIGDSGAGSHGRGT